MSGSLAIGIDVGGTKIAGGLLDAATGATIARRVVPTRPERGGAAVLNDAVALARDLTSFAPAPIAAIGVGVPEMVDPHGRIASAQTIDWRALPVLERFAAVAPTTIEADVRAAAMAEARLGAGKPYPDFAYISLGTGISSTLVIGGLPYAGARGGALVLASGPITAPCPRCGEPTSFVLEAYAAGPALAARYQTASGVMIAGAEAVVEAAESGDAVARSIIASAADALGSAIGWLVNVADPAAVVIGGGLGAAPGPYWDRLPAAIRRHIWSDAARSLPIVQAALGPDAGWIGAALSGMEGQGRRLRDADV